ncbi:MAG: metallophosphoesterase [Candidatus Moranbacteria bacterium]|nr:metallophosphoesterase [Candidatus Moranbacteria bacterium]
MFNKVRKILKSSVVFLLVFPAYIAAHIAVYFSILHFFPFSMPFEKNIVKLALFLLGSFLGFSIMISTLLAHRWDNHFNRKYYFLSGVWVGFMINLLLFFAFGWIIVLAYGIFGGDPNEKMLGLSAVVGAFLYSVYGIINAFTPVVKRIDVSIKNLPKKWIGKKVVHISDVHLGHIYRDEYLREVVKRINSLRPDAVVITGDLFDGTDGNIDIFIDPLNSLEATKGIFYASGNHEIYLGIDRTFETLGKTKITCLRNEIKMIDGLQFIGIEYPKHKDKINVAKTIKKIPNFKQSEPSILLWHMPTQVSKIRKLGISLMLSGHTHKGQLFPFGMTTRFMFNGYDYGLKRKGNFSIYTSCGLGAWGTPMRTEKHSEIVEITLLKGQASGKNKRKTEN